MAPRAEAIDTAMLIPRALKLPVGLRASSLIQMVGSARMSGVKPSERVTASSGSIGNTSAYRHREAGREARVAGLSVPGPSS